jgi:hypothetical protein
VNKESKGRTINDPGCLSDTGSRIRISIKEFEYFNPKKWFLSTQKYDPGCPSDPDFLPIPDPGSRGQKGTGSRIRIRNTACPRLLLSKGVARGVTDERTLNL